MGHLVLWQSPAANEQWLPAVAVSVAFATLLFSYIYSREFLPPSTSIPLLSLMGTRPPAQWIYSGGFTVVMVLWLLSGRVVSRQVGGCFAANLWPRYGWLWTAAYWMSVVAGVAVGIQGIVPIDSECQWPWVVYLQPIIHKSSSGVLFISSLLHEAAVLVLYGRSTPLWESLGAVAPYSFAIKASALVLAAGTTVLVPLWWTPGEAADTVGDMTPLAILQWTFVVTLLVFYGSYSLDLHVWTRQSPLFSDALPPVRIQHFMSINPLPAGGKVPLGHIDGFLWESLAGTLSLQGLQAPLSDPPDSSSEASRDCPSPAGPEKYLEGSADRHILAQLVPASARTQLCVWGPVSRYGLVECDPQ